MLFFPVPRVYGQKCSLAPLPKIRNFISEFFNMGSKGVFSIQQEHKRKVFYQIKKFLKISLRFVHSILRELLAMRTKATAEVNISDNCFVSGWLIYWVIFYKMKHCTWHQKKYGRASVFFTHFFPFILKRLNQNFVKKSCLIIK